MCENVFVQRQLYFKGIPAWSGMDFQGLTLTYFYARAVREWLQIYTRATRIYTRAVRFINRFHYKIHVNSKIFFQRWINQY